MSDGAEYFLKKTLGEDFMESLQKFELWKPGTKSTVDHEEIRTALQIVPRTIIALLIKELAPMAIGDNKVVNLFVANNAVLNVTKHERDVYSGDVVHDNIKIVDFKFRSIPGVGLVIMSAFELYDMQNLINSPITEAPLVEDAGDKIQKIIDERLALHDLISQVVDKKIAQKDAVHSILLAKLTEELEKEKKKARQIAEVTKIATSPGNADANEYMRGMANGLVVADSVANDKHDPKFVESPKKKARPLHEFLQKRQSKKEYSVEMVKGERVDCPDCRKNIFDGKLFSGCICLGADMDKKVFINKSEDGIKVRFSKGWDEENIEMLLEVLRRKHE